MIVEAELEQLALTADGVVDRTQRSSLSEAIK